MNPSVITDPSAPVNNDVQHLSPSTESVNHRAHIEIIEFGKICGEHPAVESVRQNGIGFFRELPIDAFTADGLREIVRHTLLHVVRSRDLYLCIGFLRLYRLLKQTLAPADVLPVIVHQRMSEKDRERYIRLDLLLVPVLYCLDLKDRRRMALSWESNESAEFLNRTMKTRDRNSLARILNCDPRSLLGNRHDAAAQD